MWVVPGRQQLFAAVKQLHNTARNAAVIALIVKLPSLLCPSPSTTTVITTTIIAQPRPQVAVHCRRHLV
jgi:hypothetical protein